MGSKNFVNQFKNTKRQFAVKKKAHLDQRNKKKSSSSPRRPKEKK